MSYSKDAQSVEVGPRLKELRVEHGMSMRALAQRSGLSANALSMIERGRASPSVSTLSKLAEALGISITEFFGQILTRQDVVFVRSDERVRVPFSRGLWEGLGGEAFTGRVEPFVLTLEAGGSSGTRFIVHTGHELVYCLRGTLEYMVQDQLYELHPGDSLLFAAHLRHRWRNPGKTVTNALIVLSGFAEGRTPHSLRPPDQK
jgi:transcriptional regulator with XRE-family HTH domain